MKKALIIINPVSGKRRIIPHVYDVVRALIDAGYVVTTMVTRARGDGTILAEENAKDYDLVCATGGDGSLQEVITGVIKSGASTPVGYIPCGSTNVFATCHDIPLKIPESVRMMANGNETLFDVGKFDDIYFNFIAAFGAFSWLSYTTDQAKKNLLGSSAYFLEVIPDIPKVRSVKMKLVADGVVHEDRYLFGAINNAKKVAGLFDLPDEYASTSDGQLDVLLIKKPETHLQFSEMIFSILTKQFDSPLIELFHAKEIEVYNPGAEAWSIDGEKKAGFYEAKISCIPGALKLKL